METLLQAPAASENFETREREKSSYNPMYSYVLPKGDTKHYSHQFADMYFLRLAKLKPSVEAIAEADWEEFEVRSPSTVVFFNFNGVEDCWRESSTSRTSARCAAGPNVLGGRDSLCRHAS